MCTLSTLTVAEQGVNCKRDVLKWNDKMKASIF